jgi:hypothetical protein
MFRAFTRRERRPLWSVLAFLLAVGLGYCVWSASQAQSGSVKAETNEVRIIAQTDLAELLQPRDLENPIVGERAAELGADIDRSIEGDGPIEEVRIYSSVGRILFAEDAAVVGTRPSYIRGLTSEVASGRARSVVRGSRLQTYVPIRLTPGGPVAVAELSQPYAPIASAQSGQWNQYALIAGGLLLFCIVMVVITSRAAPSAPKIKGAADDEREPARVAPPRQDRRETGEGKPLYLQEGFREVEERRQEAERRANVAEQNLGGMQKQLGDALTKIKDLEARLAVKDSETETNGAEIRSIREELKDTLDKLNKADLENAALRERMNLRQREFEVLQQRVEKSRGAQTEMDELKTKLADAELRSTEMAREIERLEAELGSAQSTFHMTKLSEALREFDTPEEADADAAPAQPAALAQPEQKAPVSLRDRLRKNAPEKVK